MKKLSLFIAFAMLAAFTMVSCNNKQKEPTQEEVQEMKQALADTVLAQIDAWVDEYITTSEKGVTIRGFELTEKEKQVKPDYLLDPAEANKFVTKTQKVNALAIYVVELGLRNVYDMPVEDAKAAIVKLAAEVNYPIDINKLGSNVPLSELIKSEYEKCRENGDLALFWQFENAIVYETHYNLANNSELFFSKITEKQWRNFCQRRSTRINAIKELAQYDEEMAALLEFCTKNRVSKSDEERNARDSSIECAKQFYIANKDKYIAKRNALLQ